MSEPKYFFQRLLDQVPKPLRNKYFLVLVLFFGWMIFADKHNVITQWRLQNSVNKMEEDKEFYTKKIEEARANKEDYQGDTEKYARERYHMKKKDEDVYIIVDEDEEKKND